MRILISSRNTLIPAGLRQTLSGSRHHVQAHYFQSIEQLIAKSILERTDAVVLDKSAADVFTFEELLELRKRLPKVKILMLSTMEYLDFIQRCFTTGIEGYLTYDCSPEEIDEALEVMGRGGQFFCQKILTRLLPRLSAPANVQGRSLTDREREIASLIAEGKTNKQIGEVLCISPHTVHTHRKSLMKKLQVSSAREIALYMLAQQ